MGGVIFVIPITLTIAFNAPKMEPAGPSQIRVLHDVPRLWNFDNILGFRGRDKGWKRSESGNDLKKASSSWK